MPAAIQQTAINEERMNAFSGKVVGDSGASLSSALVYLGEKLGLYRELANGGAATPAELAQRTNTNERYVREWLQAYLPAGSKSFGARLPSIACSRQETESEH